MLNYSTLPVTMKTWMRLWNKVQKTPTCWLWVGGKNPEGYGRFGIGSLLVYPHRLIAEFNHGPIPPGMVVDHLCRTPACVRPDHLEIVSMRENTVRGTNATMRAHVTGLCKRGHSLSEHGYYRNGTGQLVYCRECARERRAAAKAGAA